MNIFRITNCSVDYFPKNRVIATICRPPLPCGVRPGRSGGTGGAVSGWRSEERKASCGVLSGRSGRRTRDAGMRRRRPDRGPERLSEKAPNGLKNARIPENGDVYMKTFSDLCSRIRFVRASFGRRSAAAPSGMPGTATDDRDRFRTIRHETTAVFSVGGPSVPPHCGPESRNATFGRAPQGGFCRPAVAGERLRPAYRCKFRICFLFLR